MLNGRYRFAGGSAPRTPLRAIRACLFWNRRAHSARGYHTLTPTPKFEQTSFRTQGKHSSGVGEKKC